jgi:hypothetical protein
VSGHRGVARFAAACLRSRAVKPVPPT